ncbi:DUF1120 domain-containing protein [Pseudomonas sp. JQ170]|uniref:DUF1120 domain-containing protein n=1 Tax=unclassified Pseudomonas TaxID=196821 RepID=UPI00264DFE57|nr:MULTISPECIES: DUF1120 domain-containing protein [unclassified Pseudomonas]MDN7139211.1 DUF1120 domain-containing protein [Pseudomonas sp. JQ170]WRO77466.1 DUF1120 domain-containing protein [Pseudomonas sp. 170C]
MKTPVISFAIIMALASAQSIASTTEVTLTGTLTPSACTPLLSNGGVIDYGRLSIDDLESLPIPQYQLPNKLIDLTIQCEAPTTFALINSDNRKESLPPAEASNPSRFGLGKHQGEPVGYMLIKAPTALVDGTRQSAIASRNGGQDWIRDDGFFWRAQDNPDSRLAFGAVATGPTSAKQLTTTLQINGRIQKALDYSSDVQIDGSTTFEIRYL